MLICEQLDSNFDMFGVLPTEEDFKRVAMAIQDYERSGDSAYFTNSPAGLAKLASKNKYLELRIYFATILLHYSEAANEIKAKLKQKYSIEDMQKIADFVKKYSARYIRFVNEYVDKDLSSLKNELNIIIKAQPGLSSYKLRLYDVKRYDPPVMRYAVLRKYNQQTQMHDVGIVSSPRDRASYWGDLYFDTIDDAKEAAEHLPQVKSAMGVEDFKIIIADAKIANLATDTAYKKVKTILGDCYVDSHCGYLTEQELNESLVENMSREQLIKNLQDLGKYYHFEKYTTAQLYNIYKKTLAAGHARMVFDKKVGYALTPVAPITKNETPIGDLNKRCETCGRALNYAGECPYCDLDDIELDEDIEKHNELNPKLWEDNKLKPEVKEKIELIINEFLEDLKEDEISIDLNDIILVGSNCSYNYTKDSDLDIHILAKHIDAPENLYDKIYSAYRSIFSKKLDIDFYGIPVEIYVETEEFPSVSNGIYSVMNDEWVKEPVKEDIPEIDKEAFDKEFKVWEDRYNKIVDNSEEKLDEEVNFDEYLSYTNYKGYDIRTELALESARIKVTFVDNNEGREIEPIYVDTLDKNKAIEAGKRKIDNINESLHEDVNTAKSIIADQIRGEWEAIQNYNKASSELKDLGNFDDVINILNSIADEEEVHVGELEKAQSLMDNNVLDNIEDGRKEAEEDLSKEDFSVDENLKLTEAPDIFGIETDSEIDKEADDRKLAAYQKRKAIIDGDILTELHNNSLGDLVACGRTIDRKKQIIIDFINYNIPIVRKGPNARGISNFAYNAVYKDKPLDQKMVEKFADYYIDYWKNNDRIKKYRIKNSDGSWISKPLNEKLNLQENSLTLKQTTLPNNYYLECRWDKDNGYEIIGGYSLDNGFVNDDFHKYYATKEAALKAYEKYINDKTQNESLKEAALNWSEQAKKMDDWYVGRRGANVAAMSDEKLEMNARICKQKGYTHLLRQLESEARRRGIRLSTMVLTFPSLFAVDIPFDIVNITKHYQNDPQELISQAKGSQWIIAIMTLICLILKANTTATELKNELLRNGYQVDIIKSFITNSMKDTRVVDRITGILNGTITEGLNEEIHTDQIDKIDSFLNDIYELRQTGLQDSGEYGIPNLIFKEVRNKGYLDNLKDLKNQLIGKELSLESLEEDTVKNSKDKWVNKGEDGTHGEFKTKKAADAQRKAMFANGYHEELEEMLDVKRRLEYKNELSRITHNQAIIQDNGMFNIYNVKEDDLSGIISRIRRLPYIEWVQNNAGKYDFSHPQFMGPQKRYYNIVGKIKEEI